MAASAALGVGAAVAAPPKAPLDDGLAALEASDFAVAERAFEQRSHAAGVAGDQRAAALVGLARVELRTGRPDQAAKTAAEAVALAAAAGRVRDEAVAVEGQALLRLGKGADALARLERAASDPGALESRALLAERYERLGRHDDARRAAMPVIEAYNGGQIGVSDVAGLTLVGRAAHVLRSRRDANDAYNQAERAGPRRVDTLLARADLFLATYDPGHAEEVLRDALAVAAHDPRVHAKLARTRLEQGMDFEAAEREAAEALTVDRTEPEALFVKVAVAVWRRDFARADQALDTGLAACPNDLDLLAMRAVARLLADDRAGFDRGKKAVFALAPDDQRFYEYVGTFGEWLTRYDDFVPLLREATSKNPDQPKVWATLGTSLLRMGQEKDGLLALHRAWDKDHFNVRVFNTLNLFERDIAQSYETVEGSPFRVRYDKSEKGVLSRYVPAMLHDGFRSMSARYGFAPEAPVTVELYASREHFAVRVAGLPVLPLEGVCFGRVITAVSPKAVPVNWGVTLWHELGHVFALQLSKGRVPKWFTEGLSEYETIARRPEWKREQDPLLYVALESGRIPSVEQFDDIFMRAHVEQELLLGYYASSQLSVFLVETFGMPKIAAMLRLWGTGAPTSQVFRRALGSDVAEVNQRFQTWLHLRLRRYDAQFVPNPFVPPLARAEKDAADHPNEVGKLVDLALSAAAAHDAEKTEQAIVKTLAIDPLEPNIRLLRARMLEREGHRDEAERALTEMAVQGSDGYAVRLLLGKLAARRKDDAAMRAHLTIAHGYDPQGIDAVRGLFELADRDKRADDALEWLRKLAQLDQDDRKAYRELLDRLVARRAWKEARAVAESAMFVDVENPTMHVLYAAALSETGEHAGAVYELESALACDLDAKRAADVHALLAGEHTLMGNAAKARAARAEALRLDPSNPRASKLKVP